VRRLVDKSLIELIGVTSVQCPSSGQGRRDGSPALGSVVRFSSSRHERKCGSMALQVPPGE
jgi:hypothetical protein